MSEGTEKRLRRKKKSDEGKVEFEYSFNIL
jgi:hypothetical protein